ncbi:SusC/RagA family TonB-linked outer membrane protein [Pedobacter sp. HMWF019]|uniref:SusC/RagA family TonB-linked outer membrane protein n=1 Tax=Pedobacter sp. HMWF019 TaxID=2056856 RepID=UPI000D375825|nr:SusC/RagA family TonB-linked outer membrane protein [Pedobacter sp. HMWF019]PTS95631.1 SusC/RagA family TonB-linked outer membrane protein [Pedobacter sp. HMWF019]
MNFSIHRGKGMRIILPKCRSLSRPLVKCIVMSKIVLLLLALSLQVSANIYAQQQVTLNVKNADLTDVLSSVREQTGYMYMLRAANTKLAKPITLTLNSVPLETALQQIFSNQPFSFELKPNMIVIKLKPEAEKKSSRETVEEQQRELNGIVLDDKRRPLEGATVILTELNNTGTVTDQKGRFRFVNVPANGTLLIRMIGHESRQVSYKNSAIKDIILKEVDSALKEIQIIAYGTQLKKYSTNNVGIVTAADIAKQPVNNPLLALQGRVPGLFIQQSSGVSGSNVKVNIQGINSLGNGSDPFYVIDGVPYTPQFTNSLANSAYGSIGGSTFNFINPVDIESITVLKDADATAIYGSRAANGAILITTKKGKSGKTKIDVNLQNGWGEIDHKLNFLNTQQYLEMRKEAYANAGQAIPTSPNSANSSNYDLIFWDQNRYTDWQKALVGNTARFTNLQASISGGSANTQFLVSYGYNRQTTVYPANLGDIKGNVHLNLNHNSANNKFHYNISAVYLQDKNTLGAFDLMDQATKLAPNAPALYNADGTLNWEPFPNNPLKYSFNNPLAATQSRYKGNNSNLIANNTIGYEIIPGLQVKTVMGFNRLSGDEILTNPLTAVRPDFFAQTRSASFLTNSINSWSIEPQITYTKETKYGVIDAVIGSSFQQTRNDLLSQTGTGYTNDAQLGSLLGASGIILNQVDKTLYKYNALFGRINYRVDNKYIINLTARRDGSSRFGDENKLHTFYAIGGAWLFGDENILRNNLSWLSTGKIRASYGTTGNDQIGNYRYLSLLTPYSVDIPYGQSVGLIQSSIANPLLQWEETRKLNIGMDLGFLKDRILLSVNYYSNRSSNQLIGYRLPDITGFGSVDQNFPATVQNKGFEAQLDLSAIKSKDFNWHSSFNISFQRNKLIAFPGLASSSYADLYIIGQPINIMKVYKFAGVNSTTGLYQFIDHTGKTTSNPDYTTDRTVLLDPNPKFFGGLANNLQYKNFQLDFFFQFVNQIGQNYKFGKFPGASVLNQPTSVLRRWQKVGDITDIQKFTTDLSQTRTPYSAAVASDEGYVGASYVRLKNISLSYSVPTLWLNRVKITQARIFMQGQNLLTFTNFIGSDPETHAISALPPLRIMTLGIQITL